MISEVTRVVTFVSFYALLLTALMIVYHWKKIRQGMPVVLFITCVMLYLIIDHIPEGWLHTVLISGPFLLPFSFWLFSKAIFNDKALPGLRYTIYIFFALTAYYFLYFTGLKGSLYTDIAQLGSGLISFGFIFLGIYEALKDKGVDLIENRKRFRYIFTFAIGFLAIVTILVELGLSPEDYLWPRLLQRITILGFSTYFLIVNTNWKNEFFTYSKVKPKDKDQPLIDSIRKKMETDHFYRNENLNVRFLADELNEQEYKVRRAINQHMGYRNFNDFLNSFRINDAKNILSDPREKQVTVLEVAYKVGFNSIGPFNRAFKNETGLTPTEYRRKYM